MQLEKHGRRVKLLSKRATKFRQKITGLLKLYQNENGSKKPRTQTCRRVKIPVALVVKQRHHPYQ